MNLKLVVAILMTAAMATYALAQDRSPVVTAAQMLVKIISSDPAKVETYCTIGVIGVQIEDANEAKDKKTADLLTQKMRGLEKQLGPEYLSLMHELEEMDPESDDVVEIEALLRPLDRSCAGTNGLKIIFIDNICSTGPLNVRLWLGRADNVSICRRLLDLSDAFPRHLVISFLQTRDKKDAIPNACRNQVGITTRPFNVIEWHSPQPARSCGTVILKIETTGGRSPRILMRQMKL